MKNYQVEAFKRCTNSDQQLGFMIATLEKIVGGTQKYLSDKGLYVVLLSDDLADAQAVLEAIKAQV